MTIAWHLLTEIIVSLIEVLLQLQSLLLYYWISEFPLVAASGKHRVNSNQITLIQYDVHAILYMFLMYWNILHTATIHAYEKKNFYLE